MDLKRHSIGYKNLKLKLEIPLFHEFERTVKMPRTTTSAAAFTVFVFIFHPSPRLPNAP